MKRISKVVAIMLSVMMAFNTVGFSAPADKEDKTTDKTADKAIEETVEEVVEGETPLSDFDDIFTVSLRIEGAGENLYYNEAVTVFPGDTLADLLVAVSKEDGAPEITREDSKDGEDGAYVLRIVGVNDLDNNGNSGWSYRVNGVAPPVGVDEWNIGAGEDIVVFYGDPLGVGMQYPEADVSRFLIDGIIRVVSMDTGRNEAGDESRPSEKPVVAADVYIDGELAGRTDHRGEIIVTAEHRKAGYHALQIERYNGDTGVPTVLRLSPDYRIYVPFTDTPDDAWFSDAIQFCVDIELFNGVSVTHFSPTSMMTMEQLITVLARLSDVDVAVGDGPWYSAALEWAIESEIIGEDEFKAGTHITRETFIYMFYLTADLSGRFDMVCRYDIEKAIDYNGISEEYLDAVSWAVASGIIGGTSEDGLTIDPGTPVIRAVVCQMLLNFYTVM